MCQWPLPTVEIVSCQWEWHIDCLSLSHPLGFFCPLFSFNQLEQLSHLQQSAVPLQFPLLGVVISTDATPSHWAFYFQGSGLPFSIGGSWAGSMCRAHFALQELQVVATMLHRMVFCLSGKVVALHLDKTTDKAHLCNQADMVSALLSRLACQILSLTKKHGITLIPAYIPTHLNLEAIYLWRDQLLLGWHLLSQMAPVTFCLWGLSKVDLLVSSNTTWCQYHYILEAPQPLGSLRLNAFNHPWSFQVS